MLSYDHDVLGVGNPNHPANQKEKEVNKECLFDVLKDGFVCEKYSPEIVESINEHERALEVAEKELNELIDTSKQLENDYFYNKLKKIKMLVSLPYVVVEY